VPGPIRKPLFHPLRTGVQITPRAVELFTEMKAFACTCAPIDWDGAYWVRDRCEGCEQWWTLHAELHRELRARLWDWPVVESPNSACPYPAGSAAAQAWKPDEEARARWRALEAGARELRRARTAPSSPPPTQQPPSTA